MLWFAWTTSPPAGFQTEWLEQASAKYLVRRPTI